MSVLEGGADAPTGMAATEDEYDQEDSFLADSGELFMIHRLLWFFGYQADWG